MAQGKVAGWQKKGSFFQYPLPYLNKTGAIIQNQVNRLKTK